MKQKIILSVAAVFIILTAINILGSLLPIGVGDVASVNQSYITSDLPVDDKSSMALLLTSDRMSFISSRPISYYSLDKFYSRNALMTLVSAVFITFIIYLLRGLELRQRLYVFISFSLLIVSSVHLSYWNWWGFSDRYSLGVSLSTIIGLILSASAAGFLISKASGSLDDSKGLAR